MTNSIWAWAAPNDLPSQKLSVKWYFLVVSGSHDNYIELQSSCQTNTMQKSKTRSIFTSKFQTLQLRSIYIDIYDYISLCWIHKCIQFFMTLTLVWNTRQLISFIWKYYQIWFFSGSKTLLFTCFILCSLRLSHDFWDLDSVLSKCISTLVIFLIPKADFFE